MARGIRLTVLVSSMCACVRWRSHANVVSDMPAAPAALWGSSARKGRATADGFSVSSSRGRRCAAPLALHAMICNILLSRAHQHGALRHHMLAASFSATCRFSGGLYIRSVIRMSGLRDVCGCSAHTHSEHLCRRVAVHGHTAPCARLPGRRSSGSAEHKWHASAAAATAAAPRPSPAAATA